MKIFKKTLAMLSAVAVFATMCGAIAFAETEMTAFPQAPAVDQMYVRMQADDSIKSGAWNATGAPARGMMTFYLPTPNHDVNVGIKSNLLMLTNNAGDTTSDRMTNAPYARRIQFESTEAGVADNTPTSVNSGYLMVHCDEVQIGKRTTPGIAGFGFSLEDKADELGSRMAQFQIVTDPSINNGDLSLKIFNPIADNSTAGTVDVLDISDWGAERFDGTYYYFDLKMLVNLDTNTYDIYVEDRPLVLSAAVSDGAVNKLALLLNGVGNLSSANGLLVWKTVDCYSVDDATAAQYRQASLEKAFNRSFTEDNAKATLFYTYGGETTSTKEYRQLFADDAAYRSFECEGVDGLSILAESADVQKHMKVYFTADNMTAYNYDNLEYVYVSEPEKDLNNGTVSGTYELIGGKAKLSKPVILSALYTDTERNELVKVAIKDSADGVYECSVGDLFTGEEPAEAAPTVFIWGGKGSLLPLFERVDFDFE